MSDRPISQRKGTTMENLTITAARAAEIRIKSDRALRAARCLPTERLAKVRARAEVGSRAWMAASRELFRREAQAQRVGR